MEIEARRTDDPGPQVTARGNKRTVIAVLTSTHSHYRRKSK
jgi:hypothetical protein